MGKIAVRNFVIILRTNIIWKNESGRSWGHCGIHGMVQKLIQNIGLKIRSDDLLRNCRCRWKNDIEINLRVYDGRKAVEWIQGGACDDGLL
jgi:hypothetical protein